MATGSIQGRPTWQHARLDPPAQAVTQNPDVEFAGRKRTVGDGTARTQALHALTDGSSGRAPRGMHKVDFFCAPATEPKTYVLRHPCDPHSAQKLHHNWTLPVAG